MNDNSGVSVSTAGDVNGDGLDDLIVGSAYEVQLNGISKAGKSYTPLLSFISSPLMTKPPVPLAITDRLIVVLSVLPKMT
jgi:hypothetical protein